MQRKRMGKVQVDRLIADRVEQLGYTFSFSAFFKDDDLKTMGVM